MLEAKYNSENCKDCEHLKQKIIGGQKTVFYHCWYVERKLRCKKREDLINAMEATAIRIDPSQVSYQKMNGAAHEG
jgi:hypothetical protein